MVDCAETDLDIAPGEVVRAGLVDRFSDELENGDVNAGSSERRAGVERTRLAEDGARGRAHTASR